MDYRVSEAAREEVSCKDDNLIVCAGCPGCGYGMWTNVRDGVPTKIRCFRSYCAAITVVTVTVSKLIGAQADERT